ncbi:MAG: hypothetical protein IPH59_14330 [bacterium]|nr:hypothetical protein [bacterium]
MTETSLRDRLRTWQKKVREGGLDSIFYALTWRLPAWFFRYTHAYLVLANDLDVVAPDTKAFRFRLADLSDAENFALLGVSAKTVRERLGAGDYCGVAVREDGMVCSMVWASTGRLYLDGAGTTLDCEPEGVYVYNSFTLAELRGHSLYRGCSAAVCDWFKREGRSVRYGIIDKLNEASFKANGRINLKNDGESRYFRFCGLHLSLLTNWPKTSRRLFISIGRRTRGARIV